MGFARLRGFKDVAGDEARVFARVEESARNVFSSFGFEEIRVPILEEKEVFVRAMGETTDVVQKEMYEFTDRSDVRVALRPEGTAGVVRAYLENHFDKTKGLAKLFYMGPMFRGERPQAGRLRQFHQIGVETLGTASPHADAEAILCLAAFLDAAGAGGYRIKLNNLGSFEDRSQYKEALKVFFKDKTAGLCDDCKARLDKNVFRLLDCKNEGCRKIARQAPPIDGSLSPESKAHYAQVEEALKAAGAPFERDAYMVRGLDYYTKTVFEVTHPKLGAQDALGAGGRYDKLIEAFGGAPAGAVGFAVGVERLLMVLAGESAEKVLRDDTVFVATLGEKAFGPGFQLANRLRRAGVRALVDFAAKSLKSQLRSANDEQARWVLIAGEDELSRGELALKDLKNGTQETIQLSSAVETLKGKANV